MINNCISLRCLTGPPTNGPRHISFSSRTICNSSRVKWPMCKKRFLRHEQMLTWFLFVEEYLWSVFGLLTFQGDQRKSKKSPLPKEKQLGKCNASRELFCIRSVTQSTEEREIVTGAWAGEEFNQWQKMKVLAIEGWTTCRERPLILTQMIIVLHQSTQKKWCSHLHSDWIPIQHCYTTTWDNQWSIIVISLWALGSIFANTAAWFSPNRFLEWGSIGVRNWFHLSSNIDTVLRNSCFQYFQQLHTRQRAEFKHWEQENAKISFSGLPAQDVGQRMETKGATHLLSTPHSWGLSSPFFVNNLMFIQAEAVFRTH